MMVSSQSYCFSCIVTLYFFFLVSVVLCTLAHPTPHYCRDDQRDTLLEFKHEFPVSNLNDELFSSWNKSSDCCSWDGVTCDAKSGRVISLSFIYCFLNSSLKTNSSLFKLQHLQRLTISNCGLYGEIPSSLGNLSHLTTLELAGNKLVGQIPASLGNLSLLTSLFFPGNELVGQVPASLGNLTQLEYLNLGYNNFSGNIPVSFANLVKLSTLIVSGNQFTSGNFFFLLPNLTSMSSLYLDSNNFQSEFSPDMSGLQNLTFLDASENSFFGSFPKSLFANPSLLSVNLRRNQFKGPIEFGNTSSSSRLIHLSLDDNDFDGPIPESISKLVQLSVLDLSNNKFEGQVPGCLRRLETRLRLSHNAFSSFGKSWEASNDSTIMELMLNSNSFQGPFPHWICNLKFLWLLELSNNLFNGSIPPCLRNSTSLIEVLVLRNNSLTGTLLPDIFFNATSLSVLDVSRNQLEGKLPKSLINCKRMRLLNVGRNKIKDEFPSWLGSLPKLNIILLRSNQFYGPLYRRHVSIWFQDLRVIDVSHNDFTGKLSPDIFSNWLQMTTLGGRDDDKSYLQSNLFGAYSTYNSSMEMVNKGVELEFERIHREYRAIDFSENRFWGEIPESIGFLKRLHLLNLSGNTFTGNIPSSLENLKNLETLDLSRNRLSGQIPQGLGSLSSLSYMNFSYNNLGGLVPRDTQFQRQNCSSFMNNPRLYGLEEICAETHVSNPMPQQPEESPELEEPMINWIAAVIAYGLGVLCGLVIGHMFDSHRHKWSFVEKFGRNKPKVVTTSAH